jgi:hypothetical protein
MSLQAKKEQCQRDIEALEQNKADLQRQIEAEGKVELRHGDYGFHGDGDMWVVLMRKKGLEMFGSNSGSGRDANIPAFDSYVKAGNIFDDLKAMQEDVTEFEIETGINQNKIKVDSTGKHFRIVDKYTGGHLAIAAENLPDFILKLRQMQAYLKREATK